MRVPKGGWGEGSRFLREWWGEGSRGSGGVRGAGS